MNLENKLNLASAEYQLAIERSYLQQIVLENRTLSEKSFRLEAMVEKLQDELNLSEKLKSQYKTQSYASEARITYLEQKLKSTNQMQLEQEMELSRLKNINKEMETNYETTIQQQRNQIRDLEATLDAAKTAHLREKLKHEKEMERMQLQFDIEKQKYYSLSKRAIEDELDYGIFEDNKALLLENSKLLNEIKNQNEQLEVQLEKEKIENENLTKLNKKMNSKLKKLEKKVIPSMKNDMDRHQQYILYLQQKIQRGGGASSNDQEGDINGSKSPKLPPTNQLKPFKNDSTPSKDPTKNSSTKESSEIEVPSIDKIMKDYQRSGLRI